MSISSNRLLLGAALAVLTAHCGASLPPLVQWGSKDPNALLILTEPDHDLDGVDNLRDRCPDLPEDVDSFRDDDGCPDGDNDGDGIGAAKEEG